MSDISGVQPGSDFYVWDANRSTLRWDSSVYDDAGEDLIIFDGLDRDPALPLNITKERSGKLTDFLYSPLLLLFVSGKALAVFQEFNLDGTTVHPLVIRNRDGTVLDDDYFWLNCRQSAPLLDRNQSTFVERDGRIVGVDRFVVDPNAVPDADLFRCKEPWLTVFSAGLKAAMVDARLTGATFEPLSEFRNPIA